MNIIDCHTHNSCSLNAIINIDDFNIDLNGNLFYSAGLHPWMIEKCDDVQSIFSKITNIASQPNVVAIGECGIDKLINTPINLQINLFEKHIALSESLGKPLIIHCVRAWQELLSVYKHFKPSQKWILHGFRGKPSIALKLAQEGLFLSFGSKFNIESIKTVPNNLILIETDDCNQTSIHEVAQSVAMALNISTDDLLQLTSRNLSNCLSR